MIPASREDFKAFCLRTLGDGAVEINVTEEQLDDAVDVSLNLYRDYHYDAIEKIYYKYQIQDADRTNGYITVPDYIIGITRMFPIGDSFYNNSMWNINYQIALNDLWTFTSMSMVPYYMAFQHIQLIEQLLIGNIPIRFNRRNNKIFIDTNWTKFVTGQWLIFEGYQVQDPDQITKIWNDRWLQEYCTSQIKLRWGNNTGKYGQMKLPGGLTINGQQMKDEAKAEIKDLTFELKNSYAEQPEMMIG